MTDSTLPSSIHEHSGRWTRLFRAVTWACVVALMTLLAAAAFRGYLSPALLLEFANSFYC